MASAFRISTSAPRDGAVLLTFDDGPHPQGTPAVLAELERGRARAVFFLSGEQVVRYPALVREVVDAGHEIGVHGYRHQMRRQWTAALLREDTKRCLDVVGRAGADLPRLYRPPYGAFTLAGLRVVRELGLQPLLWSRWGRDWERRATATSIAARVTDHVRAGDVVLLHDSDHYSASGSWQRTAAALPLIFERLDAVGLSAG